MLEIIAKDDVSDRSLGLIHLEEFSDIFKISLDRFKYFVLFFAGDFENFSEREIRPFLENLIDRGLVYLCTWGNKCKELHDLCDKITLSEKYFKKFDSDEAHMMTTWHDDESMEEALWFSVLNAFPAEKYFDECSLSLSIVYRDKIRYELVKKYFLDFRAFCKNIVENYDR